MTMLAFLADALYDVMLAAVCAYAAGYLAWKAVRLVRRFRGRSKPLTWAELVTLDDLEAAYRAPSYEGKRP